MWFKQSQIFYLTQPTYLSASKLASLLKPLAFKPCLPSMMQSVGFVSPIEEDEDQLVRGINDCLMFCLQVEEKILPANVINHTLKEKVKLIELEEARKIRQKEKMSLKDEITLTLLPRAFTKFSRFYAYIDTRDQLLYLDTASLPKAELFLSLFKKAFGDNIASFATVRPAAILTSWLKNGDYPKAFSIEKSCVLQDSQQQNRVIRAQQQDLFASSIQTLLRDGCEVIQLGLCWQDKINFVIAADFTLRNLRLAENDLIEIKEIGETAQQKFDADLLLMSDLFKSLYQDLLEIFAKKNDAQQITQVA